MIKALLREQDPKTQTRRTRGLDKLPDDARLIVNNVGTGWQFRSGDEDFFLACPYGVPGDQLWCKENFAVQHAWNGRSPSALTPGVEVFYTADDRLLPNVAGRVRSSIHMPRWASRITLQIESVKVERVQDISEEDARAEGVVLGEPVPVNIIVKRRGKKTERSKGVVHDFTYRGAYCRLWDQINGAESWKSNCWCWVLSFRRVAQAQESKS